MPHTSEHNEGRLPQSFGSLRLILTLLEIPDEQIEFKKNFCSSVLPVIRNFDLKFFRIV